MAAPNNSEAKPDEIINNDQKQKETFEQSYNQLLKMASTASLTQQQQQTVLTAFVKQNSDTFDFKPFKTLITQEKNTKLFVALTELLTKYNKDYDIQTAIFQTIRVLSRSKIGIHVLMEEEFHKRMVTALKSYRRKLIVQTLAVMANLCFLDKEKVTSFAKKHKTYIEITDILTNKNEKFKKKEDKIYFLGLNSLFYLCLDKEIGKAIYDNDSFFRWLFDLFLDKSQHFTNKQFWIRNVLKNKIPNQNPNDEEKTENNNFNTDEDCRLIVEVLRILFNFTLVETNVLKFKLDKFEAAYQKKVVGRAVALLALPCTYEPEFDAGCNAQLSHLCETPGLISIKLKICNVALYDGDILGMNLKMDSVEPLCQLMEFYCMQTRHKYETQPQIAAMMMFLKAVCRYNGKVRQGIKRYIFGDDADPNNSDSESDNEEDDQTSKDKMMAPKHLDAVVDGQTTVKNLLIQHCTSVNYSVKRTVAEFLFALCGDDQKEMIRLCGLGNAIGIFVDKGIPGFVGAANNATNLDDMARLRREKERKMKAKNKKANGDKSPPKKDNNNEKKKDNNDKGSSNNNQSADKPKSG